MKATKSIYRGLAVTVCVACCLVPAVAAVRNPAPATHGRAAQIRERLQGVARELGLSDEQKARLKELYRPRVDELRELWKDPSLSREQKLEKFKSLQAESEPEMKRILTAQQYEQWQNRKTQAREGWKSVAGKLGLSDDQKAKLKEIAQPQLAKLRELRQDQTLTPREKLLEAKALRDETAPQVKEVLTQEQYEQWREVRGQMLERIRQRWQGN